MAGILTVAGQLARAAEFRFDYWHTKAEHRFIAVRKGWGRADGGWAIIYGPAVAFLSGPFWDGEEWNQEIRGRDAFHYELEEALVIANRIALEENQKIIAVMEGRFPGEFRGGPYDMAVKGEQ